ncbi:ABC transporter ATP-binding protein [Leyella stercorea]|uniref:ABC transporter ATP-binding protein n=1 Tax=Leyella stercorea TaxID=363265 RepID=UPI00242AA2F2|nr:ABC transporter ATP-binding protein [Leyella stercorea]
MNEELSIELCHLTVGYSKKGVQLSQLHQQSNNTNQGVHLSQVHQQSDKANQGVHLSQLHQQSNEAQRLVQLRQLHPLGACCVASDLNATALPGTLTCLIGHNGTGKSTLLRTIARLQPSIDGRVQIGGNDISTLKPTHLSRMLSIVLTSRPDVRNMTVEELVALGRAPYTGFWGRLSADDRRIVRQSIESVGITAMAERRVCTLSDGEMQKVMIAKSLAQQTPVILLDEPTAFLDFPGKIDLMLLLQRLAHEERKTILLSTHDLETALQTADRLWLLANGALHDGTPHELADKGFIDDYIGRKSVKFDKQTLSIQIL